MVWRKSVSKIADTLFFSRGDRRWMRTGFFELSYRLSEHMRKVDLHMLHANMQHVIY
jgi:hypothetical protein